MILANIIRELHNGYCQQVYFNFMYKSLKVKIKEKHFNQLHLLRSDQQIFD